MRRAINENPLVQIALLGAMAAVLAVVFLMQMGGRAEAPPAAQPAPAADSATSSEADALAPGAAGAIAETAPEAAAAEQPALDREGLPAEFVSAYGRDVPVAIFIVRDKPESDKTVAGWAERLRSERGAAVITIHPRDLGEWVRVVGPVGVDRTPALVVVDGNDANQPTAAVSYGFRNYESVQQAVRDARHAGPTRGYDPG